MVYTESILTKHMVAQHGPHVCIVASYESCVPLARQKSIIGFESRLSLIPVLKVVNVFTLPGMLFTSPDGFGTISKSPTIRFICDLVIAGTYCHTSFSDENTNSSRCKARSKEIPERFLSGCAKKPEYDTGFPRVLLFITIE